MTLSPLIKSWEGIIHKTSRGNENDNKHDPMGILHRNSATGPKLDFIGKREIAIQLGFKDTELFASCTFTPNSLYEHPRYLLTSSALESFSAT